MQSPSPCWLWHAPCDKHSNTVKCYENPPFTCTPLLLSPWTQTWPITKNILETCYLCQLKAQGHSPQWGENLEPTPLKPIMLSVIHFFRISPQDIPGGPMVKPLCSQCRGPRFDPWLGNYKIPRAMWRGQQQQQQPIGPHTHPCEKLQSANTVPHADIVFISESSFSSLRIWVWRTLWNTELEKLGCDVTYMLISWDDFIVKILCAVYICISWGFV